MNKNRITNSAKKKREINQINQINQIKGEQMNGVKWRTNEWMN